MRLPTPAGKQLDGQGVCKAAVAGDSCSGDVLYTAATARCEAEDPKPPPQIQFIIYAFSCILKAGLVCLLMHCPVTVQVPLGRSEKPTEAEWHGPAHAGALGPDLILVQAKRSHRCPAGLLQSKGMSEHYVLSLGSTHLPLDCLLSSTFL